MLQICFMLVPFSSSLLARGLSKNSWYIQLWGQNGVTPGEGEASRVLLG